VTAYADMSAFGKKLREAEGNHFMFWCPGCKTAHGMPTGDGPRPRWGFNRNPDAPTFTPSILVRGHDFTEKGLSDLEAWREAGCPRHEAGFKFDGRDTVCHSFVTDGKIQFLSDCTHALAGQTIDLPDFPL